MSEHPVHMPTPEQTRALDELRYRLRKYLDVEVRTFLQRHPELQVHWNFTLQGERRTVYCLHCREEHEVPECH